VRLALPEGLRVTREGIAAKAEDIKLGHVVVARAGGFGDSAIEALALDMRLAVAGRVERREADTIWVLGQPCLIAQAVADEGLRDAQPGQVVAVSGLRRADGAIIVSRLDPWAPEAGWLLRGKLEPGGTIAGVPVGLAPGLDLPEDAQGKELLAKGSMTSGGLLAETLRVEPANPFGGNVGRVLVETYLDGAGRAPTALGAPTTAMGEANARVVYAARVTGQAGGLTGVDAAPAPTIGQRELPGGGFARGGAAQGSGPVNGQGGGGRASQSGLGGSGGSGGSSGPASPQGPGGPPEVAATPGPGGQGGSGGQGALGGQGGQGSQGAQGSQVGPSGSSGAGAPFGPAAPPAHSTQTAPSAPTGPSGPGQGAPAAQPSTPGLSRAAPPSSPAPIAPAPIPPRVAHPPNITPPPSGRR